MPSKSHPSRRGNRLVLVGLTCMALLWATGLFGVGSMEVLSLLVAPDWGIGLCLLLSAAGLAFAAWRSPGRRRAWAMSAILAVVVSALFVGRVLMQGVATSVPPAAPASLRVVSWNAQGIDPATIAERLLPLAQAREVSVIVLPETGDAIAQAVSERLTSLGWSHVAFEKEATSVMMRTELATAGGYHLVEGNPPWAGITVEPRQASASTPVIVAVHVQQPSPGNVSVRRQHLDWIESLCNGKDFVLAVGDFNSTPNHLDRGGIGRCRDVASAVGAGASSTWPTWLPSWLGISIDRAIVSPPFTPEAFGISVLRDVDTSGTPGWGTGAGSDHWPILVEIATGTR